MCDKGFIWSPSNCECECDEVCDVGEYLDYENCKCKIKLVAPLIEECIETVEEVKLAKITLAKNINSYKCSSCIVYTVLLWMFFTINVGGTGTYYVYFHWYLKKDVTRVGFDTRTQQRFTKHINEKIQTNYPKVKQKIEPIIFKTIRQM